MKNRFSKKILFSFFLTVISLLPTLGAYAQPISREVQQRLYYTAKVWGFLKNYHPLIQGCNRNADDILLTLLPKVINSVSDSQFNTILDSMFSYAGIVHSDTNVLPDLSSSEERNLNLSWFQDPIFSHANTAKMDSIYSDFRLDSNCYYGWSYDPSYPYIYLVNENQYSVPTSLQRDYRLLLLFRYWNIINYQYPYKYAMDIPWDSTLMDYIPKCLDVTSELDFHLFFAQLQTRLNDSHAFTSSSLFQNYFGTNYFPFAIRFTEGKTVITRVFDKSAGVKVGDVILAIDGVNIDHFRDSLRAYTNGSNSPAIDRNINNFLVCAKNINAIVKIDDGQGPRTLNLSRNYSPSQYSDSLYANQNPIWTILSHNVGYVDMGRLMPSMVDSMYAGLKKTQAIIFDVRNYPNGTMYDICDHILEDQTEFVRFTYPLPNFPGVLYYQEPGYFCGPSSTNDDWYQGKVLILINEETQSHAEFTVMSLQTHPNAVTIGSQTAGADGNVIAIDILSDLALYYTSIGVYYPDWSETQRIGIQPDIQVTPTVEGTRNGVDEVLNKALSLTSSVAELPLLDNNLHIYPNPAEEDFRLTLPTSIRGPITISITDILGNSIPKSNIGQTEYGNGEIQIQLNRLVLRGTYFLNVLGENYSGHIKLIKN
jgi:carboxyl-terminal processing protease